MFGLESGLVAATADTQNNVSNSRQKQLVRFACRSPDLSPQMFLIAAPIFGLFNI